MPKIDRKMVKQAAMILRSGGLVAMPTETVYGLAADATNDKAVAAVFEAKGRPQFNPLIVHVTDVTMAESLAEFTSLAKTLAAAFWPGPLTLVLPRRKDCALSLLASAGLDTIALRSPAHPIAHALLKAADCPLAAPSANPSGMISPTTAEHVAKGLFNKVDLILDGGPSVVGVESTIVKIEQDNAFLLRSGGLEREKIEGISGRPLQALSTDKNKPLAPGMMASHYAPASSLRLQANAPSENEAYLAFGPAPETTTHGLNLSGTSDLREAAANLFAHLHALDATCQKHGLDGIAAAPIPNRGLGEAINDRLRRAAAVR